MTKPVEEMSMEEIQAERAAIAAERAALANGTPAIAEALTTDVPDRQAEIAELIAKVDDTEEPEVPAWPHQHLEYGGLDLEVRKPNESALIAISMTGIPSLGPQGQMRIFTQFLVNHLSPTSFAVVVESMTNPDSGVDIQGLITELTKL
jgi:hypothetical protein